MLASVSLASVSVVRTRWRRVGMCSDLLNSAVTVLRLDPGRRPTQGRTVSAAPRPERCSRGSSGALTMRL